MTSRPEIVAYAARYGVPLDTVESDLPDDLFVLKSRCRHGRTAGERYSALIEILDGFPRGRWPGVNARRFLETELAS